MFLDALVGFIISAALFFLLALFFLNRVLRLLIRQTGRMTARRHVDQAKVETVQRMEDIIQELGNLYDDSTRNHHRIRVLEIELIVTARQFVAVLSRKN